MATELSRSVIAGSLKRRFSLPQVLEISAALGRAQRKQRLPALARARRRAISREIDKAYAAIPAGERNSLAILADMILTMELPPRPDLESAEGAEDGSVPDENEGGSQE